MSDVIYTIGHSNHPVEKFIELLVSNGITAVADVRSHPYSRYNSQFNRERLQSALKFAGLAYVYLGRELGARSDDPSHYVDGKVRYDRLAGSRLFQGGLTRLAHGAASHRIALMCAEKDPLTCHRAILICRHLADRGMATRHILEDGRTESHEAAITRLLAEVGLNEPDLFRNRDELIQDAYDLRGKEIAYCTSDSSEEPAGRL